MLKSKRATDEIPTSPMADIAFFLVIYFMVTVTFAATHGLDFGMPPEDPVQEVDPVASILVEVSGSMVWVDGELSDVESMWTLIEPKLNREPGKPVLLRARAGAVYGDVVTTFDRLRRPPGSLESELQIVIPTEREIENFWL